MSCDFQVWWVNFAQDWRWMRRDTSVCLGAAETFGPCFVNTILVYFLQGPGVTEELGFIYLFTIYLAKQAWLPWLIRHSCCSF